MKYTGLDLIDLRKKFNLSQKQLGSLIGSSYKTVLNYEKTGVVPQTKWAVLDKLSEELEAGSGLYHIQQSVDSDIKRSLDKLAPQNSEVKEIPISSSHELELIKKIDDTEFRYIDDEHMLVICPFVSQYAYAGYLAGFSDPSYPELLPRAVFTLDELKFGAYRAFAVKGDSMDNGLKGCYSDGDIVYAKVLQWHHVQNPLQINRHPDWIIVSKNEGVILKEIINHDVEKGEITYHSLNPEYPDQTISLDDVLELLYVVEPKPKRK